MTMSLGVAIGTADTVISVPSGLAVGSYPAPFTIDSEYILVTGGGSGSQFYSVERGQNGSARAAHALGAAVTAGWGGGSSSLSPQSGSLASDFPLNTDTAYHTVPGCSVNVTPGTWLIVAQLAIQAGNSASNAASFARLTDGTTPFAIGINDSDQQNHPQTINIPLVGLYVASGNATVSLQAKAVDAADGNVVLSTLDGQPAGSATHITAIKVA